MIINVKRTTDLRKIKHDIVLGTEFGVRQDIFTLNEILEIKSSFKYKVYVNMDKIIHETELKELETFLVNVSTLDGIYFSDFSVYTLALKHNLVSKLIYNPGTLVTNCEDVEYLLNLGIMRVCLSRELTLLEIRHITSKFNDVEVLIHGKVNMFYSKRPLLTNYFEFKNIENVDKSLYLEEEFREGLYKIEEDKNGTHIFNLDVLNSYDEINEFKTNYRIDGYSLSDIELLSEINNYEHILNGQTISLDKTSKNSGFYYKETKEVKS